MTEQLFREGTRLEIASAEAALLKVTLGECLADAALAELEYDVAVLSLALEDLAAGRGLRIGLPTVEILGWALQHLWTRADGPAAADPHERRLAIEESRAVLGVLERLTDAEIARGEGE